MRAKRNIHKTIRNDSCKIKKYVFSDLPPTKEKTAARIPPMHRKSRLRWNASNSTVMMVATKQNVVEIINRINIIKGFRSINEAKIR